MSHIPYGYRIENGKAVIDEKKADQVRKLYEGYLTGLTYVAAGEAARLKLYHSGAKKMMQNKYYLGDGFYPAIIQKELFDAAETERINRQNKLGRVFDDRPPKVSKAAKGFTMPKILKKYNDPFKQAEYAYSLIESEVAP